MDHITKTLTKFGLTSNEIKVYQASLKTDDLSPFKLSTLTHIPRTTVYEILMSLSLKGLIRLDQSDGFTKQQTRVRAFNPSVLRDIVWRKRNDLSHLDVDLVNILPQLKGDYHRSDPNADFQFFPGIEGAKKTYFSESMSNPSMPIWAFENLMSMDVFGKTAINQDVDRWLNQPPSQVEVREIIGLTPWSKHALSYQFGRNSRYLDYRQIRCVDDPNFFINQRIALQGNNLKITTLHQDESWGLSINSPSLVNTLRSIFQFVWSNSTPVTPALINSWGPNEFLAAEKKGARLKK